MCISLKTKTLNVDSIRSSGTTKVNLIRIPLLENILFIKKFFSVFCKQGLCIVYIYTYTRIECQHIHNSKEGGGG